VLDSLLFLEAGKPLGSAREEEASSDESCAILIIDGEVLDWEELGAVEKLSNRAK
jgi:hypothetical protein